MERELQSCENVEKLDVYEAIRQHIPFTILSNNVLQNLREPICLAVWCYIQSLPADWKIIKSQIQKHFMLGADRTKKVFAELSRIGLIEYVRERDSAGRLGETKILLKNGDNIDWERVSSTGVKNHPVVNHTCGFHPPTNTIDIQIQKKDTNTLGDFHSENTPIESTKTSQKTVNKRKKNYKDDPRFMRFYGPYPRKEKPQDAYKAFLSIVGDDDGLLEEIVTDVELRKIKSTKWKDKRYISYPASYLRSREFEGEIYNEEEQLKEKNIQKEWESKKRQADLERISQLNREHQLNKNTLLNLDGKIYREIVKGVAQGMKTIPEGLKTLKGIVGIK